MDDEEFYPTRKERKAERKIASKKDRSKYKKTDWSKHEELKRSEITHKLRNRELAEGRVLSIHSEGVDVEFEGKLYLCTLSGLLKKEVGRAENLVAVGDLVRFDPDSGLLCEIQERRSLLSRQKGNKEQILAANIDQLLIIVSMGSPPLKMPLVDRYIIAAMKGRMAPLIVVNKMDLLEKSSMESRELFEAFLAIYPPLGIPVIAVSAETQMGFDTLKEAMKGKSSLLSGTSGVGKSSLINQLTGLDLATGELAKTQKGSHTTTQARCLPLPFGGWCIDTPGIRSFGLADLQRQEIEEYFTEIHELSSGCRYPDCTHSHEPQCAVTVAIETGRLHPLRLLSYLKLIHASD